MRIASPWLWPERHTARGEPAWMVLIYRFCSFLLSHTNIHFCHGNCFLYLRCFFCIYELRGRTDQTVLWAAYKRPGGQKFPALAIEQKEPYVVTKAGDLSAQKSSIQWYNLIPSFVTSPRVVSEFMAGQPNRVVTPFSVSSQVKSSTMTRPSRSIKSMRRTLWSSWWQRFRNKKKKMFS